MPQRSRPCILAIALTLGCALAQTSMANPLSPQDVARLRTVLAAEISPDGQHIAYTLSVPRAPGVDDDGLPWTELWVLPPNNAPAKPFTTGKTSLSQIQWTPDGRHIAFLAKRDADKTTGLYLIPIDGGEARRALTLPSDIQSYSFAPDNRRVAVIATNPEPDPVKKRKDQGFKQEIYEEDWELHRVRIATLFDTNTPTTLQLTGHVHNVAWSPIDDTLLVALAPTPSVDDSFMEQRLHLVDAATGALRGSVPNRGKLGPARWSPDGKHIAFLSAADLNDPSAERLMIAATDTGSFREIQPGLEGSVVALSWIDPARIAVVVHTGMQSFVGEVDLADGRITARARQDGTIFTSISASRTGSTLAAVAHARLHPAEVFTLTATPSAVQRRTDSNPWLANATLATQEPYRHKARDGIDLEGVLIRPSNEKPATRYPLILAVHGGPESHISDGWLTSYSNPGHTAAARGFAVFHPNYRGSTGRGVAFSKLGQGDAAGKEFDDLVDAVDALIGSGLVDSNKVGITGGSYGGYATAWCSTRYSHRFAAGVMFVGISDKISKVGTTDIANEEFHVHALKRPWDDWQFFLERSPIYHTQNARTPLLILHGKDDPRVNPGQSREIFRHLKLRNQAPVRLVLYPGEGHGNRKAAARLDYHLRLLQWMEHYLHGPGGPPPPFELEYPKPNAG